MKLSDHRSDRITIVGKPLDFIVEYFTSEKIDWFVLAHDGVSTNRPRSFNAWMLEIKNNVVVRAHNEGFTYAGKTVTFNGDLP